jgi:hypothetical protein
MLSGLEEVTLANMPVKGAGRMWLNIWAERHSASLADNKHKMIELVKESPADVIFEFVDKGVETMTRLDADCGGRKS